MTPERLQQIEKLFHSALEREPAERASFLAQTCGGDDSLCRAVESLLAHHEQAGSFIESPATAVVAAIFEDEKKQSLVSQSIGRYQVLELLGAGGMGDVYLAQDMNLARQVALKLLPAHFTGDVERLRRFEQEARAASALNHPNILTIYEIGHADSMRYIAMEFIEGVTLRARIAGKPMKRDEALEVALQVASALAAAHARGIVHRDIKPENIMISRGGHLAQRETYIKVLDFGIAKLTEPRESDAEMPTRPLVSTSHGITMGTAPYMSPEQVRGDRVDARTDIWSLGAVLYEMLAGKMPFVGEKAQDINASILRDEPLPLAAEIPDGLRWLVKKALRKDREDRYQTAREMFSDLLDLLEHERETEKIARSDQGKAREMIADSPQASGTPPQAMIGGEFVTRPTSSSEYLISKIKLHKLATIIAVMTLLVMTAGIIIGSYEFISRNKPKPAVPFQALKVDKLTVTGKARGAAISSDGKTVAYIVGETERQSIRIRNLSTSSELQIVSPADAEFIGPAFSPDGGYVYYLKRNKNELINVLYQVPVLGGISKKIIEDVDNFAFSPDGKQLAFVRLGGQAESCVMLANSDGSEARTLVTRKLPSSFIADEPVWSADAKTIFCGVTDGEGNNSYATVVKLRVTDGAEETFTSKRWGWILGLASVKDGGLVVAGGGGQIWYLSTEGVERKITDDSNSYQTVSVSDEARTLVAVQYSGRIFNIWIKSPESGSSLQQITTGIGNNGGATWTPDSKIVYTSDASGSMDIWIMDQDGGNRKQLTVNVGTNYYTSITADGRYIVFVSHRSGKANVWRMDSDGSNPKQLTKGDGEPWPYCSSDGKWVVYESGRATLWKVPLDGGEPSPLTDKHAKWAAVSPDGKLVACAYFEELNAPAKLAVIPIEGGLPVKLFDLPATFNAEAPNFRWAADGSAVTYIDTRGGASNIWSQPLNGRSPKQLTDFKSERIVFFNWSRDGKGLAITRGNEISDVVLIRDIGNQQ